MTLHQVIARPVRVTIDVSMGGLLWVILFLIALSGCSSNQGPSEPTRAARSRSAVASTPSLPTVRKSEFRNAGEEAHYVDNHACIECHQAQFDSYLQTAHSRAFDEIDVDRQPPDAEVTHELSGRSYRVYRRNDQLRHCEFIPMPGGGELVTADHPMRYVIGSGNHSRSYLVEIDGFLFESPVTWYTSRQSWGMSPGYVDDPKQRGFARATDHGCVRCHVGRVESSGNNGDRLQIHQLAIGCESCHGPGSLHIERHRDATEVAGGFDNTIVHPARLPRELQEALCGQCHLSTDAGANVRGRTIADFRPGLHLSDFQVHFTQQSQSDAMTVVGHIEQLRASRCYKMSPDMTCITCHRMHGGRDRGEQEMPGREACLNCHASEDCGLGPAARLQTSAADDCTTCHMPQSDTDIPHFAFRHHRIGIHPDPPRRMPTQAGFRKLVPVDNLEHLPEIERKRCLGLAYLELAEAGELKKPRPYYEVAVKLLEEVRKQGVIDSEVDAALARVYMRNGEMRLATDRGRSALHYAGQRDATRCDAIGALSRVYANQGQFDLAHDYLEELVHLRYDADDHLILSICRHQAGDLAGAIRAVQRAVEIRPDRPDLHEALSELHSEEQNRERSEWHRQRSRQLRASLHAEVAVELEGESKDVESPRSTRDSARLPEER